MSNDPAYQELPRVTKAIEILGYVVALLLVGIAGAGVPLFLSDKTWKSLLVVLVVCLAIRPGIAWQSKHIKIRVPLKRFRRFHPFRRPARSS